MSIYDYVPCLFRGASAVARLASSAQVSSFRFRARSRSRTERRNKKALVWPRFFCGISRYLPASSGISPHLLASPRIFWHLLASPGIPGIPRYLPVSRHIPLRRPQKKIGQTRDRKVSAPKRREVQHVELLTVGVGVGVGGEGSGFGSR